MSFSASELGLKVYIEGIQVPVIGVTTTFTEGKVASAQIQTLPAKGFNCIKPRSMVQIFYLTANTEDDPSPHFTDQYGETLKEESPLTSLNYDKRLGRRYKLLFSGEYVSFSYAKTVQGRALVLFCLDSMNYLEAIKQGASNYRSGGFEQIEQAFLGTKRDKDDRTFFGKDLTDNFTKWLGSTKHYEIGSNTATSFDPNPGTETAVNKGEDQSNWRATQANNVITGLHRSILTSFCVHNIFYAKQLNRNRIPDTLVGLRGDTTADKLFDSKVFKKWIKSRIAGGRGQYKSLGQVIQQILGVLMYSSVTIPSPKMVKSYKRGERLKPYNDWVSWKNEGTEGGLGLYNNGPFREHHRGTSLNMHLIKPDFWYFPPPACNIIFPDQYTNFSYRRDYTSEPTRMIMRTQTMLKGTGKRKVKNTYSERSLTSGVIFSTSSYTSSRLKSLVERTYAPDFSNFKELLKPGKGYRAQLYSVLMPHERYVGPNAIFTWEGDMGGFGSKKARAEYLRIFTDYLFWKVYFSARSGSLEMAFSPQIVPGFSTLIMDDMTELPEGSSPYSENGYNPEGSYADHHYGYITSVTHTINQAGANTRVELTALRHFEEDIDFDGIDAGMQGDLTFDQVAFEDIVVRPMRDYFDSRYHPENIGEQFYYPILGCRSILEKVADEAGGTVLPSEVKTKGGTLSLRDCAKRLEFMYRFRFVDGPLKDRSVQSQLSGMGHKPDAASSIVKVADKNSFVKEMTQRLGIPGEYDIIGPDTFAYNLYFARTQRGSDKYIAPTPSGLRGFIKDAEEQAIVAFEEKHEYLALRDTEVLEGTLRLSPSSKPEEAGFYEASFNPVLRKRVGAAESGIPETIALRGLKSKILPGDGKYSRDIYLCYFEQERFRSGVNTTKVPDTRFVPFVAVEGLSAFELRARNAMLAQKTEAEIIAEADADFQFIFSDPSTPDETTSFSVAHLAQIQSSSNPDKKTNVYSVKTKAFSFGLSYEIKERRDCVIKYVNALILKGLK